MEPRPQRGVGENRLPAVQMENRILVPCQAMDSESKDSLIGSFLQPPAKMIPAPFVCGEPKKLAVAGDGGPSICYNQALRTLQEKIHYLELKRSHAEENLCSLSVAAAQYKKALDHESFKNDTAHHKLMQQRKDVSVQLNAAQSRCSLLEKQLDYMRKMVESAVLENKMILEQQKEKNQNQMELHAKLEKLEVLEKECLKLTATQRVVELQTEFEINRILMPLDSSESELKKRSKKKKSPKKKNPMMKEIHLPQFHVQAGVLPFVVGKSVSSSHSLSANVQNVLHIMKHRNPRITSQRQIQNRSGISGQTTLSKSVSSSSAVTRRLSDFMLGIQDELSQMSFEHQVLLKEIQETQDSKIREDLQQRLNNLVKQMNSKGEQISKLKKHEKSVQKLKRKTQKLKKEAAHVRPKCDNQKEAKEIAGTVRESMSKSHAGQKSRSSLQLLKSVQKLQSTLKKDDIVWEQ
ncbi:centrosomal protein CEP57L1 isoform X3 [Tympanuchus pallidicinctus]|uniref:centrosomal protein CEP57L1 isoform X3 n=1 Tax=Tympanuchus pallidicinctus TaxID=109042 RepID=UPI0022872EE9|nr:centrosomal protein CEP57L1 isoform X3 [Tympanuchus pallidicinctus]